MGLLRETGRDCLSVLYDHDAALVHIVRIIFLQLNILCNTQYSAMQYSENVLRKRTLADFGKTKTGLDVIMPDRAATCCV